MSYNTMTFERKIRGVKAELPQEKVGTTKHVLFLASPSRHLNFYKAWGDRQVMCGMAELNNRGDIDPPPISCFPS